jgi:peroxiredoxin Q/BCP
MRITQGTIAPDFTATVYHRDPLTLSSLRGQKVWLAFFRYAGCPLCNLRVHQMTQRYRAWEKQGLAIVAVFQAPVDEVEANVGQQNAPFAIVCDPDEELYRLYGLEASLSGYLSPKNLPLAAEALKAGFMPGTMHGTKTRLPADFLIDETGKIIETFYAPVIGEHIPFERVDAFLKR